MQNLIFLQALPLDQYFRWQIDVQLTNFAKFNILSQTEIIIWYPKHRESELKDWDYLIKKYPTVGFFFYEDSGVDLGLYIPQLRPHSLKKHFALHKERLQDKVFFYHDSDIIFRELPDFESLIKDDINYQSNCSGYLDYSYMRSKELQGGIPDEVAINKFAELGGITISDIKKYDNNTGGAQSLLKGIDSQYWEDVEDISLAIRKAFTFGQPNSFNTKYFKSENEGFQSWTCDMWALNFALWKRNKQTQNTDELDFSWATDSEEIYFKKKIFHNAGVASSQDGLFYKGEWLVNSPIGKNLVGKPNTASKYYVDAINNVIS